MSGDLARFVAAGPAPQRHATRLLVAIGRRPRGRLLLARLGPLDQAISGMIAMERYDRPGAAAHLGWDPR